jgi:hypothetical protein
MRKSNKICENLGFILVATVTDLSSARLRQPVTIATVKAQIFTDFVTLQHVVAEKGTKILPEADIIIASKISAGPYGSSVSSFPPSCPN